MDFAGLLGENLGAIMLSRKSSDEKHIAKLISLVNPKLTA